MSQATELIAQQYMNGAANARVWADILYNVKAYGAKGDGTTDDTAAIQATIDYALDIGGKAIFFPHGTYKVTALTSLSSVVLFGDNASFVGISTTINQMGSPASNLAINVKDYGAKGVSTDDTVAIQAAIDALPATGGIVFIPDGTYMINAKSTIWGQNGGIGLRSNMTLFISPGATLKAIPQDTGEYMVVRVRDVQNIIITGGGVIIGDKDGHIGTAGTTSGHAIDLRGAKNVMISNLYLSKCWGDGIHIGYSTVESENVIVREVRSSYNNRQGLSVIGGKRIVIEDSIFEYTSGGIDGPCAGIDLEADAPFVIEDVTITRCKMNDNAFGIIVINAKKVTISDNYCYQNTVNAGLSPQNDGIHITGANTIDVIVKHNRCFNNGSHGIRYDGGSRVLIEGNTCVSNLAHGILVFGVEGHVQDNRCISNSASGILLSTATKSKVSGNTCQLNTNDGINLTASSNNSVVNNFCSENSQGANLGWNNISLESTSNTNNIQGNMCRAGVLANKPNYGIRLFAGTSNLVTNNDLITSGGSGSFFDGGTTTVTTSGNRL